MSYQQTKYEKDDPRNTDPIVSKTLGDSYWVVREIYKNLPFLRFLSDKVANLDIQNVEFQSNNAAKRIEWKYENQTTWNVLVSYEDLLSDSLAQALLPINAELASQADIMDAFAQSLNSITSTLNAQSNTINATIERVAALEEGNETFAGRVPILSLVPDGTRLVMQVTDWIGGVGTKPSINVYIGSEGYVTNIAEAENLKGSQGATGSQGIQGVKGDKGDKGDDGEAGANGVGVPVGGTTGQVLAKASNADLDTQWVDPSEGGGGGTPGADGKSAYEVAVENGFLGTEVEWLASLKGEQGEQGIQGEQGEKGDTGDAGATELAGLTDVDLTTPPTDGQVLVFDSASGTWVAGDQTGGGGGSSSPTYDERILTDGTSQVFDVVGDSATITLDGTNNIPVRVELSTDGGVTYLPAGSYDLSFVASNGVVGQASENNINMMNGTAAVPTVATLFLTGLLVPGPAAWSGLRPSSASYVNHSGVAIKELPATNIRVSFTGTAPTAGRLAVIQATGGNGNGGGGPQPTTSPADLSLYIAGKPDASEVIYRTILARELTIAGDMAGSKGFAEVNPTTIAASFLLQRNGSTVGQIIFGTTGTVAFTTNGPGDPQVFAVDDLLSVVAPSTQNAAMENISITLAFTREV